MTAPEVSPLAVARLAASAAQSVDGVIELDTARGFATHGRGEAVPGITVDETPDGLHLALRVIARLGRPLPDIAADVRTEILAELLRQLPDQAMASIDVHVADVRLDPPDESSTKAAR